MSHAFTPKVGTVVRTSVVFSAIGGGADDPGTVVCKVAGPVGSPVTETYDPGDIVRDGVGQYHLDVLVTDPGLWTVEWIGSGAGPNVVECRSFTAEDACI